MEQEEIKPSFSLKYLVLTLITTAIITGASLGISRLYESKPKKELTLIDGFELNLLDDSALPTSQIEAKYYLKGSPKKEISTLFRKSVTILNSGNEGAENLKVAAVLKGDHLSLISAPIITTIPKEIIDAIAVKKDSSSSDVKHDWEISLLNPGESITFQYSVYSEKDINKLSLNIIPRKKDWKIVKLDKLKEIKKSVSSQIAVAGLTPVIFLLSILFATIPVYRIQWSRRREFRDQYDSFYQFWMKHRPWNLFG